MCVISIFSLIHITTGVFSSCLRTFPSKPNIIDITFTSVFHIFPTLWKDLSIRLPFCFGSLSLCNLLEQQTPPDDKFFSFGWLTLGVAFGIKWSICKSVTDICIPFFGRILMCAYTIFGMVKF